MRRLLVGAGILPAIYIFYKCSYILKSAPGLGGQVRNGAVILDVRTRTEWSRGHIKGAVNIPLSELHTGTIPLDTGTLIITCCSHELRSVKAVSLLKSRGYSKVLNGGAWSDLETVLRKQLDRSF